MTFAYCLEVHGANDAQKTIIRNIMLTSQACIRAGVRSRGFATIQVRVCDLQRCQASLADEFILGQYHDALWMTVGNADEMC
jgi:hypothetical protein